MKPGARYPRSRKSITKRENEVAAFAKAATAPLGILTPAMIESIAASHARRGSKDFDVLLAKLNETVADRQKREAA